MAILRARTACSRELFGYKGIDERAVERLDALGADFEPAGELHAGPGGCGYCPGRCVPHLEDADLDLSRQRRRPYCECAAGARHSAAAPIGDIKEAVGHAQDVAYGPDPTFWRRAEPLGWFEPV